MLSDVLLAEYVRIDVPKGQLLSTKQLLSTHGAVRAVADVLMNAHRVRFRYIPHGKLGEESRWRSEHKQRLECIQDAEDCI